MGFGLSREDVMKTAFHKQEEHTLFKMEQLVVHGLTHSNDATQT